MIFVILLLALNKDDNEELFRKYNVYVLYAVQYKLYIEEVHH